MTDAELLPLVSGQYPLRVATLEHLRTSENRVWRVEAENGTRYALRLRRGAGEQTGPLKAELQYLRDLRAGTGLEVPSPVPTRTGELIGWIHAGAEAQVAVLFNWVPGVHVDPGDLTLGHMRCMARATAVMHRFARGYCPPPDFQRPVYDAGWYFGPACWVASPAFLERLDPASRSVMQAFNVAVAGRLNTQARDDDTFGLIHYDLHAGNFLFTEQSAHPIDFDELGFGYYLFDLAHLLFEFVERPDYPAFRQAAMEAYRVAGGPAAAGPGDLELFLSLQVVAYFNWLNRMLVRDGNTGAMDYWVPRLLQRIAMIRGH